jgi:PAS domain S-box-containing protein
MNRDPRHQPAPDPDTTAAGERLDGVPGDLGREAQEREAAVARARHKTNERAPLCAPDVPGLQADLLFTLCAENVREYAMFLMDADGIIRCWGEGARLMKWWTPQEAEGSHLRLLYPDGGSEDGSAEEHLQLAAEKGEYTGEGHRLRRDGSTFWAYVTLTALRNAEGRLVGFTKVTRDFTARRAVEAALKRGVHVSPESQRIVEEANRLKRLLANLSHEVRTPLHAMLGSIRLLEHELDAGAQGHPHIARLQRNGRHLLQVIEDVLDASRLDAGHVAVSAEVLRLGPAIVEALADVEEQATARGVTIVNAVSGSAADLPYWGDEGRVRQIVVNLLTNAVKFTDRGGRITVSGGTGESPTGSILPGTGPWSYVRVEDTGRGILPEHLEAVFEPYRQSEQGDQLRGAGLGLSISRQLARQMGGDLTVQSAPGRGSQFTLWLPIAPSDPIPR